MKLVIKNGYVLDPASGREGKYDILVQDGVIAAVESCIDVAAERVIDAKGLTVMPGFIDLHVHLREPGFEYKETIQTGSMAAAAGGYTTICPMPNTKPAIDSPEMVTWLLEKAKTDSPIRILPVGAITKGQDGKEMVDIAAMAEAGAAAFSEDGKSVMDIAVYCQAMKEIAKVNRPVFAHCEDKELVRGGVMNAGKKAEELGLPGITNAVEDVITMRDILLAKETGARLHLCHCSTKDSVAFVEWAKKEGISVTAEVCPHHFAMTEDEIPSDDANYKMNPPLRTKADVEALKAGLVANVMEVISTDHAPHGAEEKAQSMLKAPFGIVGSETAYALGMTTLVKNGLLTQMQLVEKMSANPAKVLQMEDKIGCLKEGACADIVLAKPEEEYEICADEFYSKGKNTPFDGCKVTGRIYMTIFNGEVVYERPMYIG